MDLIGRFTPKTLAAAVALAVSAIAANAHAAGLGRLTVQSALGQPLRAEVEITSLSKEEAASLTAKLAPPDAFKQAGLEYNPALTGLGFAIGQRADGRPIVKVTSNRPVNEPFVDLLVELNWATGKFVREYTFLLDPPELRLAKPEGSDSTAGAPVVAPSVQSPSAQISPAPAQAASLVQAPAPVRADTRMAAEPKAAPEPKVAAAKPSRTPRAAPATRAETTRAEPNAEPAGTQESASSVTTQRGDTLAAIAARNRSSGVSLDQAIVAIYRANPSAFFGSVHRMRVDATLSIPDSSQMTSVDPVEATKQVRDNSEFRKYRSRLAASSRKLTTAKAGQSASGAVAPADDGKASGDATRDELKLSKGAPGRKSGAGGAGSKVASAEGAVARDNALKEAASRVEQLQKNVKDLEKLLELKNQRIAEIEKQVAEAKAAGKTSTGSVLPPPSTGATPKADAGKAVVAPKFDAPKIEVPKVEAPKIDESKAAKIEAPALPKVDAPVIPPAASVTPQGASSPTGNSPSATVTPPDLKSVTPPAVTPPPVAEAPKPAPAPVTPAPKSPILTPSAMPVPEPGILDMLTDNPLIPGGAIALLGLGGAYAWWRRRKKAAPAEKYEDSLAAGEEFSANSLFGTTGGQQVDTNSMAASNANVVNTSMQASQTSMSGPASTEVDPIAEAEVYIAYGREAQAEEILKEALKRQPDRQAIRGKLLEIYAGRKEVSAFSALAREMHEMTGGQNEEWPKVLTQGLAIDPSNPLFSGDGSKSLGGGMARTVAAIGAMGTAGAAAVGLSGHKASPGVHDPMPATNKRVSSFDSPSLEANTDVPAMDFDLRIDSGMGAGSMSLNRDTTVGLAGSRLSQASDSGKQQSASDLARALDGKIDLPTLDLDRQAKVPGKAEPAALSDLEDFKLDLPALETLKGPPAAMGRDAHQDLSPIGLDLSPSTLMGNVGGDSARWQEMATKLDLASAYQDIGDKDGARELLDEVIRGGDTAQQQKAKAMLSKIN